MLKASNAKPEAWVGWKINSSPVGATQLARNVLEAVAQGSQIQCHYKQYPEIRAALSKLAENKSENQDEPLALLAMNEIERLDLCFANGTRDLES